MILLSELSRRRIRSVQKLIRVGRNEVVVVLRVDEEKGKTYTNIIDISKTDWLDCYQVTLIFPSVVSLLKILQSVKRNTTSPRLFIRSCDTLPKSTTLLSRNCIKPSVGPCTENLVMLMMLSSWLSRMWNTVDCYHHELV